MREEGRGIGCDVDSVLKQDGHRQGLRNESRAGGDVRVVCVGLGHHGRMRAFYRRGAKWYRLRISSGTVSRPLGRWGCGLGGRVWRVCRRNWGGVSCAPSTYAQVEVIVFVVKGGGTS